MAGVGGETGEGGRSRVFISYARVDRPRVAKIVAALEAAGHEVWWDVLIEGGAAFARSIETALDEADAVVVVWSAASIASDWVRDEAAHARDRGRLVPVSLDGAQAPLGFRQYHAIALTDGRGGADPLEIDDLVRAVAVAAGREAPVRRPPAPALGASRRGLLIAGGGVGLAAVVGGGGYVAWRAGLFSAAAANSVAVLPFRNLSGDPAQGYFSDGLAEEVRLALSRNSQLQVLAPTSSDTARNSTEGAVAIAAKLGVAFLLEGSVRRAGDTVRIAAELVDGRTGFSRWSNSFDRKLADVFAVQSEISNTVAQAMSAQMATTKPGLGGTASVAAYDAFLQGRAQLHLDTGEASDRAALAGFDAAIVADANFAAAHAARSKALVAIASQDAPAGQIRGLYDAAVLAARRAIALAPDLAAGHLALGLALFGQLEIREARGPYDRAGALGAGDADTLGAFASFCAWTARADAAARAIDRALVLDPLNPRAWRAAGAVYYAARRFGDALTPLRRALELNPRIAAVHGPIGDALVMLGRADEAVGAYSLEPAEPFAQAGLAIAWRRLGRDVAAQAAFAKLVADLGDGALYQQSQVLAQWGRRDGALAALGRARAVGDSGLVYARTDPMLDPLRTDPRFVQLLKGLGFD